MKNFLRLGRSDTSDDKLTSPSPFHITCTCGHVSSGQRRPLFLVQHCPHCQRKLLIYPNSRLDAILRESVTEPATLPDIIPEASWDWRRPAMIAGGIAMLLTALIAALLLYGLKRPPVLANAETVLGDPKVNLDAALTALNDGNLDQTLLELAEAQKILVTRPQALSGTESRQVTRLQQEVQMIHDLPFESLPDMLALLPGTNDRVADQQFRQRYAGRPIVFDATMRRKASGEYALDYRLELAGAQIIIDWQKLRLLNRLPLDEPQRMIFGFRLVSAKKAGNRTWTVEPDPDSAVLFTEPEVLLQTSFPSADDETREVLKRQARWLQEFVPRE